MTERVSDLAAQIRAEHAACLEAGRRTIEHALALGVLLIQAKNKAGHGNWLPWLTEHCPNISERHARNFMTLVRHRAEIEAKSATVADLTIRGALALAKPKEARDTGTSTGTRRPTPANTDTSTRRETNPQERDENGNTELELAWDDFAAVWQAMPKEEHARLVNLSWEGDRVLQSLYAACLAQDEKERDEWNKRLDERKKLLDEHEKALAVREHKHSFGVFSRKHYKLLRAAVHPDRAGDELKADYGELFRLVGELEPLLSMAEEDEAAPETPPAIDATACDTPSEAPAAKPSLAQRKRDAIARANATGDYELAEQIEQDDISILEAEKELDRRETERVAA